MLPLGNVRASDVSKVSRAKTAQGNSTRVTPNGAGVMLDGAKVVATDIEASNGVIQVIDKVILTKS